ncbi:MAG TPA: response regulator [Chitinophagales bacterium]|nr:response regulator [Chitinophagales bacterium]
MKTKNKTNQVFLVDDDETYLDTLEHNLKKNVESNVILKTFPTGEECLKELHQKPDIVVLDYELNTKNKTALNGIEILKKIKSLNHDIQVLMLSGQDNLEVAVNCIKNGAHDYVIKNESAFVRTAHLIKNVMYNINLGREAKRYEFWNWIIAGLLLAFVLFDLIYFISKV